MHRSGAWLWGARLLAGLNLFAAVTLVHDRTFTLDSGTIFSRWLATWLTLELSEPVEEEEAEGWGEPHCLSPVTRR